MNEVNICNRCKGSGYASAARDMGMEDMPIMQRPLGIYRCPSCNGSGKLGIIFDLIIKKEKQ